MLMLARGGPLPRVYVYVGARRGGGGGGVALGFGHRVGGGTGGEFNLRAPTDRIGSGTQGGAYRWSAVWFGSLGVWSWTARPCCRVWWSRRRTRVPTRGVNKSFFLYL